MKQRCRLCNYCRFYGCVRLTANRIFFPIYLIVGPRQLVVFEMAIWMAKRGGMNLVTSMNQLPKSLLFLICSLMSFPFQIPALLSQQSVVFQ